MREDDDGQFRSIRELLPSGALKGGEGRHHRMATLEFTSPFGEVRK